MGTVRTDLPSALATWNVIPARLVDTSWAAKIGGPNFPIFAAHEVSTSLAGITFHVAKALGRSVRTVPIPWRIPYVLLRTAEVGRMKLPVTSDSLLGLVHPMPPRELELLESSAVAFPPLEEL